MPSLGIHLAVAEAALKKARAGNVANVGAIRGNEAFYFLGSVGPDLFYAPEQLDGAILQKILQAKRAFRELTPDLSSASDRRILQVCEDLVRRSASILDLLYGGLLLGVANLAAVIQPFAQSIPLEDSKRFSMRAGAPVGDLGEPDYMHYANNGDFAALLVASPDDRVKAFGLGFLSHMATDMIGHSFTNHVVGGPFRSRPTFHHVAEQHMDAIFWQKVRSDNICSARLHNKIKIHGGSDPHQTDPTFFAAYQAAATAAFKGTNRPDVTVARLQKQYAAMFRALEFMTDIMHVDPPVPPRTLEDVLGDLEDLGNRELDHARNVANRHENWAKEHLSGGHISLKSLLDAIGDLGGDLLSDLEDLFEAAGEVLATAGTIAVRTTLVPLLFQIQLKAFEFWRTMRLVPVAMGLIYPEPDEIAVEWHTVIQMPVAGRDAGALETLEGALAAVLAGAGMTIAAEGQRASADFTRGMN